MNCTKCGAVLRKDAAFCLNCGQKLVKPIPVGGMIGIATAAGVIPGLLSLLTIADNGFVVLARSLIYSIYFMFICCLFSLKYVLLSITIMEVVKVLSDFHFSLYVSRAIGMGYDYGNKLLVIHIVKIKVVSLLFMLAIALVVNFLVKKNRLFLYILSVLVSSFSLFLTDYIQLEYWLSVSYLQSGGGTEILIPISIVLGVSCSAFSCFWIHKRFPQLMQKLR